MQTFLPFPDFVKTAKVLDYRRLGKQRVEAKQIIETIDKGDNAKGWKNHPAVLMWRNNIPALALYGLIICEEWRNRDYKDTLLPFFKERFALNPDIRMPWWVGDESFHQAHQSNLLRKLPEYYSKHFDIDPTLPYLWPGLEKDNWTVGVKPN